MSIVDRNRCPTCGKRPHDMAGINVPNGERETLYLVCWTDGLVRVVKRGEEWRRWPGIGPKKKHPKRRKAAA